MDPGMVFWYEGNGKAGGSWNTVHKTGLVISAIEGERVLVISAYITIRIFIFSYNLHLQM